MKPISLTIAGLHSFREEQEIPFAELSKLGVFGIFGPTGSGKSSILDAMTLALYGTVVRAGRRTQGILNHAEKQVKVALTFSLGQGAALRIYRVERRYNRKDQLAVNNTYSRLVAVNTGEEEVLADKDREVTEKVTALLGLKEEDFTRAVVLPQGKFAEFLNLGGKERREMLQRLFSLEQYGNVLINKVNEWLRFTETSYLEIESEQKGLGDASPATVAAAQVAQLGAKQAEAGALVEYEKASKRFAEAKEVYNLRQELFKKWAELAEHHQQAGQVKELTEALDLAEKAGRTALVLEEFTLSQANEQTAVKAKEQAETQAVTLTVDTKRLMSVYTAARETRLKKEPALIERRTKLEAAVSLEAEVSKLAQMAAAMADKQRDEQKAATAASQLSAAQSKISQQLDEDIQRLEEQLNLANISTEQRAQVQACQQAAHVLEQHLQIAERIKNDGVQRKKHAEHVQAAAKQAEENLQQAERRLTEREAAEAKAAEDQLTAAATRLDQLLAGEKQAAAARLAQELADGQPCPVCGSTHHPGFAGARQAAAGSSGSVNFEQEIIAAKEHIATLTQTLTEAGKAVAGERQALDQARTAAAALRQQAATALTELDKVRDGYKEAQVAVKTAANQLVEMLQAAGRDSAADVPAAASLAEVAELNEYISKQDKLTETLSRQLISFRQKQQACQQEITRLQQLVQAGEASLAARKAQLDSLNSQLMANKQELNAVTQGIPAKQLLARSDQELETVRREERQAQETYEQAAAALTEAEQERTRAETRWQEMLKHRELLQVRLAAKLAEEGFADAAAVTAALMTEVRREDCRNFLTVYAQTEQRLTGQCEQLSAALKGRTISESDWEQFNQQVQDAELAKNAAIEQRVEAEKEYRDLAVKHERWSQLEKQRLEFKDKRDCLQSLRNLLRGNVFVEFLAQEQMALVARQASERLKQITQHRYALEMSSDGGFLIRDDANGGVKRPVSTLSGGETFQASLALALALSAQIQLKGQYPLEFFFLDEGFGSLDQHALDMAMTTLEKLHLERLTIGVISHVAELKQRMPRRLLVEPAEPAGRGSRVRVEEA